MKYRVALDKLNAIKDNDTWWRANVTPIIASMIEQEYERCMEGGLEGTNECVVAIRTLSMIATLPDNVITSDDVVVPMFHSETDKPYRYMQPKSWSAVLRKD